MKLTLSVIALIITFIRCSLAQIITDPIRDYLTTRDADKNTALADLNQIYMIKCDLNNSGNFSVLLSFNGYGGHQGNYWTAYVPVYGGYTRLNDSESTLVFQQDTFYVGTVHGKYGLLAYAKASNGGDLVLFTVVNERLAKIKIASLDLSVSADKKEFENYFGHGPDWKSYDLYPIMSMNIDDLKRGGYDVDAALKAVRDANRPLLQPLSR